MPYMPHMKYATKPSSMAYPVKFQKSTALADIAFIARLELSTHAPIHFPPLRITLLPENHPWSLVVQSIL